MRRLDHPNIVKLLEVYEDPNYYFVIEEVINGGELFSTMIK
jgi:serine/threonine protein kinase